MAYECMLPYLAANLNQWRCLSDMSLGILMQAGARDLLQVGLYRKHCSHQIRWIRMSTFHSSMCCVLRSCGWSGCLQEGSTVSRKSVFRRLICTSWRFTAHLRSLGSRYLSLWRRIFWGSRSCHCSFVPPTRSLEVPDPSRCHPHLWPIPYRMMSSQIEVRWSFTVWSTIVEAVLAPIVAWSFHLFCLNL